MRPRRTKWPTQSAVKAWMWTLSLGLLLGAGGLAYAEPPDDPLVVEEAWLPDGLGARGGRLVLDNVDAPQTFNPVLQRESSSQAITELLHAALLTPEGLPAAAASLEVSPDERTFTLKLRRGLKFSDGTPVTADDVVFTLTQVVFNPDVASDKALWRVGDRFPEVRALDARTVELVSPVPFPPLVNALGTQAILPEHLLEAKLPVFNRTWGVDTPPEEIAGLGPFRIKGVQVGTGQVTLERNPFYWKVDPAGTQLPYLDEVVIPVAADEDVRLLRFLNGQTDALAPRPEDLAVLKGREGIRVRVHPAGTVDLNLFAFNQDAQDPNLRRLFRDERFRIAMSHAADRRSMIELNLKGLGEPRFGPGIDPDFWTGDAEDFPRYAFDLDGAARLLDEIGLRDTDGDGLREFPADYPDPGPGRPVRFELLTLQGSAVLVADALLFADDLKRLGLQATVTPVPFHTLVHRLTGSRPPPFEAARVSLGGGGGGDPNSLQTLYASDGSLHFWKYSDGLGQDVPDWQIEVDALLRRQAQATDLDQRFELLDRFQRLVAQHVPVVFLYNAQGLDAFWEARLANFSGLDRQVVLIRPELIYRK